MGGGVSKTQWRAIRRLLHPRGRRESGRVLVEGARAVRTSLERATPPELVLVGPQASAHSGDLIAAANRSGVPVLQLTAEQTRQLVSTAHSQEVFSVIAWKATEGVPEQLAERMLHLSGIRNPTNMGAILRTASAFGIATTCSPDCVDLTHPVTIRSGAGTYFDAAVAAGVTLADLRNRDDYRIVATAVRDGQDVRQYSWNEKCIVVMGGEAAGATEDLAPDATVRIPANVESLNVAVATGIILWEMARAGALAS